MGESIGPDVEYGPLTTRVPAEERPPVGADVEFGAPRTSPAEPELDVDTDPPVHDAGQADVLEQTEPS